MPYKFNPFTCNFDRVNGSGTGSPVETITGDSGGAVGPDSNFNINLVGSGPITVVGDPVTFTLTIQDDGTFATSYVTDSGTAIPSSNILNVLGGTQAAGSTPLQTTGSGNTLNILGQFSQALASTDATKVGLSAFDSSQFSVDANGFVTLVGSGTAIDSVAVQTGTSPIVPDGAGLVTFNGATVVAGTTPVQTNGTGANTYALEVQISQALAAADPTKIGLANFDSAVFTVDADGFVSTSGTGLAQTITGDAGGALSPTAGNWDILGGTGCSTSGAGSTLTINVDATVPLSFPCDSGTATPAANALTLAGGTSVAGTTPVATSGSGATATFNVQISQALAAADSTKIGLSNFDSTDFTVDADGFVELATTGAAKTITGDSGGALSPTANNWNILGLSGSKTSGSGSTLTVKSPPYADAGSSGTSTLNSGEFVTGAFTRTLPASAGLADGDLVEFICTSASALVVTANTGQTVRIGTLVTSSGGTATSTAIGDSLSLRWSDTVGGWIATSVIGTWTIA